MKKATYGIIITMVLIFGFTGCSEINEKIDEYSGDDEITTPTSATIKYSDGSIMGVTMAEEAVNGGFQIYHIATVEVVGFIGADGLVYDMGGRELGVCEGATVSDNGVLGDCTVPAENPYQAPAQPASSSNPSGACPDTRNGDFNPNYSPAVCNKNGYFWCSVASQCLDKPINVIECGEMHTR